MSRGPDAATLLERALLAHAAANGCPVRIEASELRRWASASFTGARHALTLAAASSDAFDRWLASLGEVELALRGHLVAEISVAHRTYRNGETHAAIEALTVEER